MSFEQSGLLSFEWEWFTFQSRAIKCGAKAGQS